MLADTISKSWGWSVPMLIRCPALLLCGVLQHFSHADVHEGEIRLNLNNVYTLSIADVPDLAKTAPTILDSLNQLANLTMYERSPGSDVFQAELLTRACAVLTVLREGACEGEEAVERFNELLEQYFPPTTGKSSANSVLCSLSEAASIQSRTSSSHSVTNAELRRHANYSTRQELQQLLSHYSANLTSAAAKKVVADFTAPIESAYSRVKLQAMCHKVLYQMVETLQLKKSVLLEEIGNALIAHGIYPPPIQAATDEECIPSSQQLEEEEGEEEGAPASVAATTSTARSRKLNKATLAAFASATAAPPEDEEEETDVTAEDIEEKQLEVAEEEKEISPAPAAVVPARCRPGRPTKAEQAARAATASAPTASPSPRRSAASPSFSASASASPQLAVVRDLAAASARLKNAGHDPLADSLAATQGMSKKRKSAAIAVLGVDKEMDVQEEAEEAEGQHEERKQQSPPKKRERHAAPAAAAVDKCDHEDACGERIAVSDTGNEGRAAATSSDEEDKHVLLPGFTSKKRVLGEIPAAAVPASHAVSSSETSAAGRSALLSSPSSFADPSQCGRPLVHRHASDRSMKRVLWSTEEIAKLTDGVIEFAMERKKWKMILDKVTAHMQNTTR
jgi:hypothetical protein